MSLSNGKPAEPITWEESRRRVLKANEVLQKIRVLEAEEAEREFFRKMLRGRPL